MVEELTLRPAQLADFAFCQRTYLEPMRATIEKLGLDEASHLANFARRWQVEQVRIVMMHGQVIGWLQTAATDDALFLAQLFVDTSFQRQGIGSRLMRILIEEAARENKAVTLGVVKTNPARRLYERLGFSVTHEDQYKFYMRRHPDRTRAPGIVIETARLRIRSLGDDDLADLVALIDNWEVARWVSSVPHPYSEADGREWIALVRQDHATGRPRRFAVALQETDRLIGGVGLDGSTGDGSEEPSLGYWVGQPYWRHGYGREAVAAVIDYGFRTLGLETIRAYTDPSNAASQKVLLRCGLKNVGEIELVEPTRHGARRAPLFRISRPELAS
jgi:RimJ/RimL family protein N-acetyltransferase